MRVNLKFTKCIFILSLFLLLTPSIYRFSALAQDPSKENEAIYVAGKAMEDGFYDVALSLLERFLKNYPASNKITEVNLLIGQCYFHQNKFLDALSKFESLLSQSNTQNIKDALLYWTAEVHFRGNNFSKAASFYKRIADEYPQSNYLASSYYSLGWCFLQEQEYAQALGYFKIVESRFPNQPQLQDTPIKIIECMYNLKDFSGVKEKIKLYSKLFSKDIARLSQLYFYSGEANYYLNNFQEAISEYSKSLGKGTDDKLTAVSKLSMSWAYLKLKQYEQARLAFQGIKKDDLEKHNQAVLLLGKATLEFETKGFQESKAIYQEIINTSSDPIIKIQSYLGEAESLYNLGEFNEAGKFYKLGLSESDGLEVPSEIIDKLHYGLAWTLSKLGEFKEAIKEFQKIAKQSEDKIVQVSALCQIGDAYQDAGDFDLAQRTYDSILKNYPDSLYSDYVQFQLGITFLKSSNYDGAILSLLNLKRTFPNSKLLDDAAYYLGLAYFQKQDYASSREILEKFQKDYTDSSLLSQAMYLLATSLFNLGKFPEAIEEFKEITRRFSQDLELCQKAEYEIADCYYQMGDEKEAMSRFKNLRTKYPDSSLSPEIIWWLGEYYYRHNDLGLANRYFSSLIKDFPRSNLVQDAYYILGSINAEEKRFDEAIANFKRVTEIGKSDLSGQAAIAIADIYFKQNNFDGALSSYQDIIKSYPNLSSIIYPKIADFYSAAKKYEEAEEYYRKSLEVVPSRQLPDMQFKIAEAKQLQGKSQEAVEEYLKTSYLYAENSGIVVKSLLRIAKIYEDTDDLKEASNIYKKILSMNLPESKYAQERLDWIKLKTKNEIGALR